MLSVITSPGDTVILPSGRCLRPVLWHGGAAYSPSRPGRRSRRYHRHRAVLRRTEPIRPCHRGLAFSRYPLTPAGSHSSSRPWTAWAAGWVWGQSGRDGTRLASSTGCRGTGGYTGGWSVEVRCFSFTINPCPPRLRAAPEFLTTFCLRRWHSTHATAEGTLVLIVSLSCLFRLTWFGRDEHLPASRGPAGLNLRRATRGSVTGRRSFSRQNRGLDAPMDFCSHRVMGWLLRFPISGAKRDRGVSSVASVLASQPLKPPSSASTGTGDIPVRRSWTVTTTLGAGSMPLDSELASSSCARC